MLSQHLKFDSQNYMIKSRDSGIKTEDRKIEEDAKD